MHSINSLTLTYRCIDWFVNSRHPRILHIFHDAVNLINEHREVISIVTPQIGNGPFNLVVEDDVVFSDFLSVDSPVTIHDDQLILGDLAVKSDGAKLWEPRPDWKALHANKIDILRGIRSLPMPEYPSLLPADLLTTFLTSIIEDDLTASIGAARRLAGLGIGLTPAGDDFILGVLYATWIILEPETAEILAEEIATNAASLTTSLSAAWLRSAGDGEAGVLWHRFFDTLLSSDLLQVKRGMDRILAVGASSGVDTMAGFMGTFFTYAELEEKHDISKRF